MRAGGEFTSDLLGPVPQILLLILFDEAVDEKVIALMLCQYMAQKILRGVKSNLLGEGNITLLERLLAKVDL